MSWVESASYYRNQNTEQEYFLLTSSPTSNYNYAAATMRLKEKQIWITELGIGKQTILIIRLIGKNEQP